MSSPAIERHGAPLCDRRLPGLPRALDDRYMKTVFSRHLADENIPGFATCTILAKRYKPHRTCWLAYELRWPKQRRPLIVTAELVRRNRAQESVSAGRPPDVVIPELPMRLWTFPSDPGLITLDAVFRNENLESVLGVTQRDVRILKYVPRRRCVFKAGRILAKLCDDVSGLSVFFSMHQLWRMLRDIESRLQVPQPLGYDPELKLLWRRWVDGESFEAVARSRGGLVGASVLAGQVLAALHTTPVSGPLVHTPNELRDKLNERCRLLRLWRPELTPTLGPLQARLEEALPERSSTLQAFIHGDFNHSQLLYHGGGASLIDFDTAGVGDPLYDVALFLSGLHGLADDRRLDRRALAEAALGFLQAYEERVPFTVSRKRLGAYLSWTLVCRRAHRAMRRLERGAPAKVEHYLELAERYLS